MLPSQAILYTRGQIKTLSPTNGTIETVFDRHEETVCFDATAVGLRGDDILPTHVAVGDTVNVLATCCRQNHRDRPMVNWKALSISIVKKRSSPEMVQFQKHARELGFVDHRSVNPDQACLLTTAAVLKKMPGFCILDCEFGSGQIYAPMQYFRPVQFLLKPVLNKSNKILGVQASSGPGHGGCRWRASGLILLKAIQSSSAPVKVYHVEGKGSPMFSDNLLPNTLNLPDDMQGECDFSNNGQIKHAETKDECDFEVNDKNVVFLDDESPTGSAVSQQSANIPEEYPPTSSEKGRNTKQVLCTVHQLFPTCGFATMQNGEHVYFKKNNCKNPGETDILKIGDKILTNLVQNKGFSKPKLAAQSFTIVSETKEKNINVHLPGNNDCRPKFKSHKELDKSDIQSKTHEDDCGVISESGGFQHKPGADTLSPNNAIHINTPKNLQKSAAEVTQTPHPDSDPVSESQNVSKCQNARTDEKITASNSSRNTTKTAHKSAADVGFYSAVSLKAHCDDDDLHRDVINVFSKALQRRGPLPVRKLHGDLGNAPIRIRQWIGGTDEANIKHFLSKHPQYFEIDSRNVVRLKDILTCDNKLTDNNSSSSSLGARSSSTECGVSQMPDGLHDEGSSSHKTVICKVHKLLPSYGFATIKNGDQVYFHRCVYQDIDKFEESDKEKLFVGSRLLVTLRPNAGYEQPKWSAITAMLLPESDDHNCGRLNSPDFDKHGNDLDIPDVCSPSTVEPEVLKDRTSPIDQTSGMSGGGNEKDTTANENLLSAEPITSWQNVYDSLQENTANKHTENTTNEHIEPNRSSMGICYKGTEALFHVCDFSCINDREGHLFNNSANKCLGINSTDVYESTDETDDEDYVEENKQLEQAEGHEEEEEQQEKEEQEELDDEEGNRENRDDAPKNENQNDSYCFNQIQEMALASRLPQTGFILDVLPDRLTVVFDSGKFICIPNAVIRLHCADTLEKGSRVDVISDVMSCYQTHNQEIRGYVELRQCDPLLIGIFGSVGYFGQTRIGKILAIMPPQRAMVQLVNGCLVQGCVTSMRTLLPGNRCCNVGHHLLQGDLVRFVFHAGGQGVELTQMEVVHTNGASQSSPQNEAIPETIRISEAATEQANVDCSAKELFGARGNVMSVTPNIMVTMANGEGAHFENATNTSIANSLSLGNAICFNSVPNPKNTFTKWCITKAWIDNGRGMNGSDVIVALDAQRNVDVHSTKHSATQTTSSGYILTSRYVKDD